MLATELTLSGTNMFQKHRNKNSSNMAACQLSVSLLYQEERRPLSLCIERRGCLYSPQRRDKEETVSLFSIKRRQTPSLYKEERASLSFIKRRVYCFSIEWRGCLSSRCLAAWQSGSLGTWSSLAVWQSRNMAAWHNPHSSLQRRIHTCIYTSRGGGVAKP